MLHTDSTINASKPPKKKGANARDIKDYFANASASLRLADISCKEDNNTFFSRAKDVVVELAGSTAVAAKDSVVSLLFKKDPQLQAPAATPALPKPPVNTEEDSERLFHAFAKIEESIIVLQAERSKLTKDIKTLKDAKKLAAGANNNNAAATVIDPKLKERLLEILAEVDILLIEKIRLIPELIREHARRRVDCFLYLCIAVYNKQVIISKGQTLYQHGTGSNITGTAACHSSLIPNPVVEPLVAASESAPSKLLNAAYWVASVFKKADPAAPVAPAFQLAGTYLDDLLNMTVELPTVVNDFDGQMEGKWEQSIDVFTAISILNRVAKGELKPVDAVTEFLKYQKEFFTEMDRRYFRKEITYSNSRMILYPKAAKLVWQYEMEGTFECFNEKYQVVDPNYIHIKLHLPALTKMETANYYLNPFNSTIETRILQMQNELLTSKSHALTDDDKKIKPASVPPWIKQLNAAKKAKKATQSKQVKVK